MLVIVTQISDIVSVFQFLLFDCHTTSVSIDAEYLPPTPFHVANFDTQQRPFGHGSTYTAEDQELGTN